MVLPRHKRSRSKRHVVVSLSFGLTSLFSAPASSAPPLSHCSVLQQGSSAGKRQDRRNCPGWEEAFGDAVETTNKTPKDKKDKANDTPGVVPAESVMLKAKQVMPQGQSALTTCDTPPTLSLAWLGSAATPARTLQAGDYLRIDVDGCTGANIQVTVPGGGVVDGQGRDWGVFTDRGAIDLVVTACATLGGGDPSCVDRSVTLKPFQSAFDSFNIETLEDYPNGRWVALTGTITTAPGAPAPRIVALKHTDVFYIDPSPVDLNPDGSFQVFTWLANNVDRAAVAAIDATSAIVDAGACGTDFCFPTTDPNTRQQLPVALTEPTVFDVATLSVRQPSDAADGLGDLNRLMALAGPSGALVREHTDSNTFFLYDQALAVRAFTAAGRLDEAAAILRALSLAQHADGGFAFSYVLFNGAAVDVDPAQRYSGANAWLAIALNAYIDASGSTEFNTMRQDLVGHLVEQIVVVEGRQALRFNPVDLPHTRWNEALVTSVEHNLDFHAALVGLDLASGQTTHATLAADIAGYIQQRWDTTYYRPGHYIGYGDNIGEMYLDTQAWTVLALGGQVPDSAAALGHNCDVFFDDTGFIDGYGTSRATVHGVSRVAGFFDFRTTNLAIAPIRRAWPEGVYSMVLAMRTVPGFTCRGLDADDFVASMDVLADAVSGGLPNTTVDPAGGPAASASAAAIAWRFFALSNVNPFQFDDE